MAEFAWDKLEPREGVYQFDWLDEVMELLAAKRVRVLLCTPTAVPPIWACRKYPAIHPVQENGKIFGFGLRRYTCPTSPEYRQFCDGVVTAMARRYGTHPQVLAWQIDNEIGHPFCFCDRCRTRFQEWCRERFNTIGQFNDALCTHFLGQTLQSFDEIPFPVTYPHPGLWLKYHQFFSDQTIACFRRQAETLRAHGVRTPVSTNMMITWYGYDHEDLGRHLDVIGGDHYGLNDRGLFGPDYHHEKFTHAFLRGIRHGQNIWYNEFQWGRSPNLPLPGQLRWEVLVQIGLGADLISFFRLDTCPSGMERDGYGLLGVHREPGRVYGEVQALSRELSRLKPHIEGSVPAAAPIAFLFSHDNHAEHARSARCAALQGPSGNGYSVHLSRHLQAVTRLNISADIVYPGDDFTKYRAIVAPAFTVLRDDQAAKLREFVAAGGVLVMTCLSAMQDVHGTMLDTPVPGPLADVFGIEVRDYGSTYSRAGAVRIASTTKGFAFKPLSVIQWMDEILPRSGAVQTLGQYDGAFHARTPAITRHAWGNGTAYWLGAILEQQGYNDFYAALIKTLGLKPVLKLPAGLYATVREKAGRRVLFINNPATEPRTFALGGNYTNLSNGRKLGQRVTLPPFGALVLA
jgi:beta-galactosidase